MKSNRKLYWFGLLFLGSEMMTRLNIRYAVEAATAEIRERQILAQRHRSTIRCRDHRRQAGTEYSSSSQNTTESVFRQMRGSMPELRRTAEVTPPDRATENCLPKLRRLNVTESTSEFVLSRSPS